MAAEPPIPAELWDTVPPAARAALLALLEGLQRRLADLEARLGQNSGNSHRPPSADPPQAKPAPPAKPSGKKPGGQPGHPRAVRPRLPADVIIHHKPRRCAGCGRDLAGDDPSRVGSRSGSCPRSARRSPNTASIPWPARAATPHGRRARLTCRPTATARG